MDTKQLRAMAMSDLGQMAPYQGTEVHIDHDSRYFTAKVDPLEANRMRLVPGAKYNRLAATWVMPDTRAQVAALRGLFGDRIVATDAARNRSEFLFRDRSAAFSMVTPNEDLFPFQAEGVRTLLAAGSALLGDEMGVGKTLQAIEWMRLQQHPDTFLVVCPNSMKYKWASEIEKWWPEAEPVVIDGTAGKRRKQIEHGLRDEADHHPVVFIINYESLRSHTRLAPWGGKSLTDKQKEDKELNVIDFDGVVIDEAHKIKDPKAQQTMAVKQMGLQANARLALTGTPVVNNPDDLWSIMNFVEPDEWGSRNQFRNRYCRMANAWHGGLDNLGLKEETMEEFDTFFQPRFLRRTKAEVLPELPEKFEIDYRMIPLSSKQQKLYDALADDMMAMSEDELLVAENPLSLTIRLRQAACGMLTLADGEVVGIEPPSGKLDAVRDILAEAPGDPLVIYADSRKFVEMLDRELSADYRIGLVTGTQTAHQRAQAVEAFQAGKLNIILGTLGAGAEGLTLTRANRIVLAQQSWSHATNAQAIDRVHRIGQNRGVQPIVLVARHTIDEAVAIMDRTKEGRLQQLVRDPAWLARAVRGEV